LVKSLVKIITLLVVFATLRVLLPQSDLRMNSNANKGFEPEDEGLPTVDSRLSATAPRTAPKIVGGIVHTPSG
jgi:hypothetical protein